MNRFGAFGSVGMNVWVNRRLLMSLYRPSSFTVSLSHGLNNGYPLELVEQPESITTFAVPETGCYIHVQS
jgi:hypothetical protein